MKKKWPVVSFCSSTNAPITPSGAAYLSAARSRRVVNGMARRQR